VKKADIHRKFAVNNVRKNSFRTDKPFPLLPGLQAVKILPVVSVRNIRNAWFEPDIANLNLPKDLYYFKHQNEQYVFY
jgi:hypothetical protein